MLSLAPLAPALQGSLRSIWTGISVEAKQREEPLMDISPSLLLSGKIVFVGQKCFASQTFQCGYAYAEQYIFAEGMKLKILATIEIREIDVIFFHFFVV